MYLTFWNQAQSSIVYSFNRYFWAFVIYLVLKLRQNANWGRQGLWRGACETDAISCSFSHPDLIFSFVVHGENGSWHFFRLSLTSSQVCFPTSLPHPIFFFSVWRTPHFTLIWLLFVLCFDVISSFHLQPPFGSLLTCMHVLSLPLPHPVLKKAASFSGCWYNYCHSQS